MFVPSAPGSTHYEPTGPTTLVATRRFSAPVAQVWAAWTQPSLIRRWLLGPEGWTMPVCEVDLRPGGAQRFVWAREGREPMEITGTYVQIDPPHTLVFDESWGGNWPVTRNTLELAADGHHTVMTLTTAWPTASAMERAMATGMKEGSAQSYARLDAWFETGIDLPRLTTLRPRPAATIALKIPAAEMARHMDPAIREILEVLRDQDLQPAGPMYTRHFARPADGVFDFEVGFPTARPIEPAGRVQAAEVPGVEVLTTTYRGPYEGLPGAWGAFHGWFTANGHTPGPQIVEVYEVGPETTDDPSGWRTVLNQSLA